MSMRLDTTIPDYAAGVAVSSATWIGLSIPLYGAMGWSVHCQLTNGAAGVLTAQVCNFGPEVVVPGGFTYSQPASDTIAANGQKFSGFSTATGELMGRFLRYTFAPSAAGNLYIAINVRRISA